VLLIDGEQLPGPGARNLLPQHPAIRFESPYAERRLLGHLPRHGDPCTHLDVLQLRDNVISARLAQVVQQVIAVEADPTESDLDNPGPDLLGASMDRNGPRHVEGRLFDELVPWHLELDLLIGRPPARVPRTIKTQ